LSGTRCWTSSAILALVGRPLLAHIIAVKPSHTANCELARQIVAQWRKPTRRDAPFALPRMQRQPRPAFGGG